jgi:integrase/recombinase XerD
MIMSREGKAYVLTDEEGITFCNFIRAKRHSERNLAIYLLTRRAGLRIGEVSKLKMTDVLDAKGQLKEVITLRSAVTKGNKVREAYLSNPELRSALVQYISKRPKYKCDALFVSQKLVAFTPKSLAHTMNKLYTEAGFYGASSHSGRRGAASSLLNKGLDVVSLMRFLGHANVSTTQEYVEVDQNRLLKAAETA